MDINELKIKIDDADKILIGIGEEFSTNNNSENDLICAYNNLNDLLTDKDYFVVSINKDATIFESDLNNEKITAPNSDNVELNEKGEDKAWEKYMLWLSCTLNRKLLILELGVGLNAPQVIRWPFETTVSLNNKAELIRMNETLPNIPSEISNKATSIKENSVSFFLL